MIKKNDIVYIAGPMTGRAVYNHPKFFGIAGIVEKTYGCKVLNPARQPLGLLYAEYMELAQKDLRRATVVVMLTGWKNSRGARAEFLEAIRHNLRIIDEASLLTDIVKHMTVEECDATSARRK